MQDWLEYESGHAWCESTYSKYQTVAFVAEFANTVTNLPIIILPLVNVFMIRDYIRRENAVVVLPHLLLAFNGLASTYYHATLNLFGQLVDELSILWMLNISFVAYLPVMTLFPSRYRNKINGIRWGMVVMTTAVSALCFLKPSMNAFALMTSSLPTAAVLHYESSNAGVKEAKPFIWRITVMWVLAMSFWFSDRLLCDVWLFLGIPYLHAIFHLLSSLAAYNTFIMLSLIDIERRATNKTIDKNSAGPVFRAKIDYLPFRRFEYLRLPYIRVRQQRPIAE